MYKERIQELEYKIQESMKKYANKNMPIEAHISENLMKQELVALQREHKKMSYIERMEVISNIGDEEKQHAQADDLLCEILLTHGYFEVVEIFKNMQKWYA